LRRTNYFYCARHPKVSYAYYEVKQVDYGIGSDAGKSLPEDCGQIGEDAPSVGIEGPSGCLLKAFTWAKVCTLLLIHASYYLSDHLSVLQVKALRDAIKRFPQKDYIVMIDTDAVISPNYFNRSIIDAVQHAERVAEAETKRRDPSLNQRRPIILNRDSADTWWCKTNKGFGFNCINSGTIIVKPSPDAYKFVDSWWNSSLDDYKSRSTYPEVRDMHPELAGKRYSLSKVAEFNGLSPSDFRGKKMGEQKMLAVVAHRLVQ
jgi:hypothetical protein